MRARELTFNPAFATYSRIRAIRARRGPDLDGPSLSTERLGEMPCWREFKTEDFQARNGFINNRIIRLPILCRRPPRPRIPILSPVAARLRRAARAYDAAG